MGGGRGGITPAETVIFDFVGFGRAAVVGGAGAAWWVLV